MRLHAELLLSSSRWCDSKHNHHHLPESEEYWRKLFISSIFFCLFCNKMMWEQIDGCKVTKPNYTATTKQSEKRAVLMCVYMRNNNFSKLYCIACVIFFFFLEFTGRSVFVTLVSKWMERRQKSQPHFLSEPFINFQRFR